MRVSTLSFIGPVTVGVLVSDGCARVWLSLLRLSQGKLSAAIWEKKDKQKRNALPLLRLPETELHSSSVAF